MWCAGAIRRSVADKKRAALRAALISIYDGRSSEDRHLGSNRHTFIKVNHMLVDHTDTTV